MNSLASHRRFYAQHIVAAESGGAADKALVAAFARVERERFVGPGPWLVFNGSGYTPTVSDDPRLLYQDVLVGLSAERGINNGQPSLHARCMAACAPHPGERVVHVGAGTGYYSAILAELVGRSGTVLAYEIEADLAEQARRLLETEWPQVRVVCASATEGALPPADVIYVCAGATHPPENWLDALAPGGRLVLPLTPDLGAGPMLMITRSAASTTHYAARALMLVSFIPCVGARDEAASRALHAALETHSLRSIRSLHRHTPPDATVWCAGRGWWLSSAEPARA